MVGEFKAARGRGCGTIDHLAAKAFTSGPRRNTIKPRSVWTDVRLRRTVKNDALAKLIRDSAKKFPGGQKLPARLRAFGEDFFACSWGSGL